ncbi:RNA polymerase sigma-70 factor [Pedobacter metabolipauper]|uniref:RNA polymerase sigma-70 factor (ECF subfamily) n=1 Tax=Pedobacter metabolipauper TaxID=425513 RepID=A0A4R6SQB4_9SPHI|nr:RNA polymerase sigma-70 factor [Pedobacter metabolipauper]TDQ06319.1 RNA polymerase sigma-70 factor (ECF subfamily) [Pedobacter metabolipauper]
MISYSDFQEAELLDLLKAGDYAAFNELYARHWSALYGSAYNVLRDRDSCMDIVQEVFVWFWEHRKKWELTSCKGYLLTAVKFKVANYIRNNKAKNSFFEKLATTQIQITDELAFEAQELMEFIKKFTNDLPDRCREIFHLSRFEQLSNKEIANKLGISEKTVENQITVALKKLRSRLGTNMMLIFFFL